jgi:hypothetical protein
VICALRNQGDACSSCQAARPALDVKNRTGIYGAFVDEYVARRMEGVEDRPHLLGRYVPRGMVTGWRLWALRKDGAGAVLTAPYRGALWVPGTNEAAVSDCWAARCPEGSEHPYPGCDCGIRAMTSLEALLRFHESDRRTLGPLRAVAQVELWGIIAPAVRGNDFTHTLRASRAAITGRLYLGSHHAELGERYGVETADLDEVVVVS